jgi:hypothetical protein
MKFVRLLHRKKKIKQMVRSEESTSNGEALAVRGREEQRNTKSRNRGKSQGERGRSKSRNNNKLFCKYCKKTNHMIEDCWKLKNKEKRKNKSGDDGKVVVVSGDSDNGGVLIVFPVCVSMNSKWILDSTCSYHICINKDWFSTYEPVQNGGLVRMRDSTPCEVIGIGSVKINTHVDMTQTLIDVRHIPTMFRNLISLSTLDNMGYKYFALGGVLKVSKCSLIVMKWVMKSTNLYVLSGDTIIGVAAVSFDVVVTSDNCSGSKLWHMHLGHMSQLGLAKLSKRGLRDTIVVRWSFVNINLMHLMLSRLGRLVEKQTERKVKTLRTDNGMKFCSNEFKLFCRKEGIVKHHTIPHTPQ